MTQETPKLCPNNFLGESMKRNPESPPPGGLDLSSDQSLISPRNPSSNEIVPQNPPEQPSKYSIKRTLRMRQACLVSRITKNRWSALPNKEAAGSHILIRLQGSLRSHGESEREFSIA